MVAGLGYRLVQLTNQERRFLQDQSEARVNRIQTIHNKRGHILDRHGKVLAMSEPKRSLWVNPKSLFADNSKQKAIAELAGISEEKLEKMVNTHKDKHFMFLKRRVESAVIEKALEQNDLPLKTIEDFDRFYPAGESSAQLLGQVDVDGKGIEGLELMLEQKLSGREGFKKVVINRYGETVQNVQETAAKDGEDVYLTIDKNIQYQAYKALQKGVENAGAKAGMAVVLDVKTGGVLAAVNFPSFNPQKHGVHNAYKKNRAFIDLFEPGSTFKPISMSYVLEQKKAENLTVVDTGPGVWVLNNQKVSDVRNFGVLKVDDILMRSSNIGIAKLVLSCGQNFVNWLEQKFPVGKKSLAEYPGEPKGRINHPGETQLFDKASISYGYGVSMTVLQLAQAYLQIANGGYAQDVSIIKQNTDKALQKKRILAPETVTRVKSMMKKVVSNTGTGRLGQVKGLEVAGKTGTTHLYTNKGYAEDRYIASFSGFAPLDKPQYVICVVIEEPDKAMHYGGQVAAPIFSEILFHMLYLDAS